MAVRYIKDTQGIVLIPCFDLIIFDKFYFAKCMYDNNIRNFFTWARSTITDKPYALFLYANGTVK